MGVIITEDSALGQEMRKWEQFPSKITDHPGNPYKFRPYPAMMFKAFKKENGKVVCMDIQPQEYEYHQFGAIAPMMYQRAVLETDRINAACSKIVPNEAEFEKAYGDGWRATQTEALAYYEHLQQEIADVAAEVAANVRGMTEKARREVAAADASTDEHVTDVVGVPASVRGRDRKQVQAVAGTKKGRA